MGRPAAPYDDRAGLGLVADSDANEPSPRITVSDKDHTLDIVLSFHKRPHHTSGIKLGLIVALMQGNAMMASFGLQQIQPLPRHPVLIEKLDSLRHNLGR